MSEEKLSDKEILDKIVSDLYYKGNYQYLTPDYFVSIFSGKLSTRDCLRLCEKLKKERIITFAHMAPKNSIGEEDVIKIDDRGIEIMNEYASYMAYLNSLEKIDKKEKRANNLDRHIKNGNLIATVIVSLVGIFVGISQSNTKSEQQTIIQGIQSLSNQLDSARKDLLRLQDSIRKYQKQDTATSK